MEKVNRRANQHWIFFASCFLCFDGRMKRNPPSPPKDGQNERDKNVSKRNLFEASRIINSVLSRIKGAFLCERTEVMVMPVR